jgi:hypothetical protein
VTVESHDQDIPDPDEFVVAWLSPLGGGGIKVDDDTVLPFRYVHTIDIIPDDNLFTARAIISVHTMCDASGDDPAAYTTAAKDASDATHRRMMYLSAHPGTVVTLPSGQKASVDYLDVQEAPTWVDYDNDQILQKVGTYEAGFTFVALA